jgi:hypothetical protein
MARSKFRTVKSHGAYPRARRARTGRSRSRRRSSSSGPLALNAGLAPVTGRLSSTLPAIGGKRRISRKAAGGLLVAGGAVAVGAGARAVYRRRQRRNRQRRDTRGKFR